MKQVLPLGVAAPLVRAPAYAVFVLWASVCAFAPEVIWQGIILLRSHFGAAELYTALFIGVLFTFFVEPLAERLKAGRWHLPHQHAHGSGHSARLVLGAMVSLSVGAAVVCVHEALGAFFGAGHGGEEARWLGLVRAIWQAVEWASVPAAVTAAWLVASGRHSFGFGAAVSACIWTVAVGFYFGWTWQDLIMTAVNGCLIVVIGTRRVMRGWDAGTVPALARIVGTVSLACVASTLLIQAAAGWVRGQEIEFYAPAQAYEDLRFYLGWFLGLSVAPDPVPHHHGTNEVPARPDGVI